MTGDLASSFLRNEGCFCRNLADRVANVSYPCVLVLILESSVKSRAASCCTPLFPTLPLCPVLGTGGSYHPF